MRIRDRVDKSEVVYDSHLFLPQGGIRLIPSLVWTLLVANGDDPVLIHLLYVNKFLLSSVDEGMLI